jgi:serine protease Do
MSLSNASPPQPRKAVSVFLALAVTVLAACGMGSATPPAAPAEASSVDGARPADVDALARSVRTPRENAAGLRTSFADVIEPAMDAVVSIAAESSPKAAAHAQAQIPFPWPFEEAPDMPEHGDQEAFGSGVIVRADGIILTNNHVVEGADHLTVRLHDNRELKAKVLGTDPQTDVAVIKVDATGLATLPLGVSGDLRVGDLVFAIGSPFALAQSVTMGIVSATGRNDLGLITKGYEDFIQTDAPINPGNSGGALLDSRGELIGINTAILTNGMRGGGNQGVGFAVPVDLAKKVMDQIVADGRVVRSQLGVVIQPVSAALAKSYGLERPVGALVNRVEPGSPAAAAGLRSEDLIVEVDGRPVESDRSLRLDISNRRPGSHIELAVLRAEDGKTSKRSVEATLQEMKRDTPDEDAAEPRADKRDDGPAIHDNENALRGIDVLELSDVSLRERRELGIRESAGIVVEDVEAGSPAAHEIKPGDVITSLDGEAIESVPQFLNLARSHGKGVVRLRVQRGEDSLIIALEP